MTVLLKVMDACTAQSGDLLLGEFREEHDLSTLPQLDFAAIQILTARAFWDGPLEGILEYDGNIYWSMVRSVLMGKRVGSPIS